MAQLVSLDLTQKQAHDLMAGKRIKIGKTRVSFAPPDAPMVPLTDRQIGAMEKAIMEGRGYSLSLNPEQRRMVMQMHGGSFASQFRRGIRKIGRTLKPLAKLAVRQGIATLVPGPAGEMATNLASRVGLGRAPRRSRKPKQGGSLKSLIRKGVRHVAEKAKPHLREAVYSQIRKNVPHQYKGQALNAAIAGLDRLGLGYRGGSFLPAGY